MEIKIKDKTYKSAKIPKYNNLINKLKIILRDNRQIKEFEYHGIRLKAKAGILVCGTDSNGVRPFERFYSINDIQYYFSRHLKRLRNDGERRLSDI